MLFPMRSLLRTEAFGLGTSTRDCQPAPIPSQCLLQRPSHLGWERMHPLLWANPNLGSYNMHQHFLLKRLQFAVMRLPSTLVRFLVASLTLSSTHNKSLPTSAPPCLAQRHGSCKATYSLWRVELELWSTPRAKAELTTFEVSCALTPSTPQHHKVLVTASIVKTNWSQFSSSQHSPQPETQNLHSNIPPKLLTPPRVVWEVF